MSDTQHPHDFWTKLGVEVIDPPFDNENFYVNAREAMQAVQKEIATLQGALDVCTKTREVCFTARNSLIEENIKLRAEVESLRRRLNENGK